MKRRPQYYLRIWFYTFAYFVFYGVCRILFRVRIKADQFADANTGFIVVARHRSYWDIPFMVLALGRRNQVHFIARKGLLRNPVLNPFVRAYATVIDREQFGRDDLRRMLTAMEREKFVGLFPEGTTRAGADVKSGVIHFARRTGKKILPVNIQPHGPYPPQYPFRLPRVDVSVGRPFDVQQLQDGNSEVQSRAMQTQQLGQRLMEQVDAA